MAAVKPHAVCTPFPTQAHIEPMLKLAELLHSHGFHITFVNTEYNHSRLLKSRGPDSLNGLPDFRFEAIPDGLPPSNLDKPQNIPAVGVSTAKNCLDPFLRLLSKLNDTPDSPPVSCIISDGSMSFTIDAARELSVPAALFWITTACGFMGFFQYKELRERGLFPLKDKADLTNGYLESTTIDWVPGMPNIRLKDFPSFIRTTNANDVMFNYVSREAQRASMASAIIFNTFDDIERPVLDAISSVLQIPILTIGSLSALSHCNPDSPLAPIYSNPCNEGTSCILWLDKKEPGSVLYLNFGPNVMTNNQLIELAWGLADSNHHFLWVIKPDLVNGDSAVLPPEFVAAVGRRGMFASCCAEEEVLAHEAIAGFAMHSGWDSVLASVCAGVPVLCLPYFAEQPTTCRYACGEWGFGMEIDSDVKRKEVESLIRELVEGEKGKGMKKRAMEWKQRAAKAIVEGGTSFSNLNKLVNEVLTKC